MSGDTGNPNLLGLQLKQRLAEGELALCMTVRYSRTVEVVQIARLSGYDCLYFDLEHSAMTIEACAQMSLAAAMAGLPALVRVPSHGHHQASFRPAGSPSRSMRVVKMAEA